ncbi:hypothetical protein GW17_00044330 [Ensete ventricosum]|nr:hypothetical protein GW17_00044330 [Ensete ventricosum]
MKHLVEVEKGREAADGRPSVGPAYRSAFATDGFPPPIPGVDSCWDVFRLSAERHPENRMLGHREVVDGKVGHDAGEYVWLTYKEVYDTVIKVGASITSCGVEQVTIPVLTLFVLRGVNGLVADGTCLLTKWSPRKLPACFVKS